MQCRQAAMLTDAAIRNGKPKAKPESSVMSAGRICW
jgi:hypothetical protein